MKSPSITPGAQLAARRMGVDLQQLCPGARLDERQAKAFLAAVDFDRSGFIEAGERPLLAKLLGDPAAITSADAAALQQVATRAGGLVQEKEARYTEAAVDALSAKASQSETRNRQVERAALSLDAAKDVAGRAAERLGVAADLQAADERLENGKVTLEDGRRLLATMGSLRRQMAQTVDHPWTQLSRALAPGLSMAPEVSVPDAGVSLERDAYTAASAKEELDRADLFLQAPLDDLAKALEDGVTPQDELQGLIDRAGRAIRTATPHVQRAEAWRHSQTRDFIESTWDFRVALRAVHEKAAALAKRSPSAPGYAQAKQELAAAEGALKRRYGYTSATAPAPGTLWVDPQFLARALPEGKLTAAQFPAKAPAANPLPPPSVKDILFANGRTSFTLFDAAGRPVTVRSMEAYQGQVKTARAGMPRQDGEPIPVHLSLEGGGGKGKRYGAAYMELLRLGVVPASLSGASAGSIAAVLFAAGADPAEVDRFMKQELGGDLYDIETLPDDGGVMNGQKIYDALDKELRKILHLDRPVTYADLKVPVKVIAAKTFDSKPPAGQEDMSRVQDRVFVFSQDTTPNTPVALGVRASMAIPGVFDPVDMVDPTTGRELQLIDGGVLDNLPMGYQRNELPVIGLSLAERGENHPDLNRAQPGRMPSGSVEVTSILANATGGGEMYWRAAAGASDYRERVHPAPGTFMLNLPTWDPSAPEREDTMLGFSWQPEIDVPLDAVTRDVTRAFIAEHLADFGKPGASGTNTPTLSARIHFEVEVPLSGVRYRATYDTRDGGQVTFTAPDGDQVRAMIGQRQIEAMYLDDQAFGGLEAALLPELRQALEARANMLMSHP